MGKVTRRSVASKEESTPKESPKSGARQGAKKDVTASGDSPYTPKRGGRQVAKEQKVEASPRASSSSRGRSTSRGGRGKKEEPESKEETEAKQNDEEVEEEKPQRGSTRSRGKGKADPDVKTAATRQSATRGRRGAKVSEAEEKGDDVGVEKEVEEVKENAKGRGGKAKGKAAATVATPSPRGQRRGKSKIEPDEEEKMEDETTDGKLDGDDEIETTPKGRQRRTPKKDNETSVSPPSSGGRKGRGQKATPKTSPAGRLSSRHIGKSTSDKASDDKDDKSEQMKTVKDDEGLKPNTLVENQESSSIADAAVEKKEDGEKKSTSADEAALKEEPSSADKVDSEAAAAEIDVKESTKSPKKKRKHQDVKEVESPKPVSPNKRRKIEDNGVHPLEDQDKAPEEVDMLEGKWDNKNDAVALEDATEVLLTGNDKSTPSSNLEDGQPEDASPANPVPVTEAEPVKLQDGEMTKVDSDSPHENGAISSKSVTEDQNVGDTTVEQVKASALSTDQNVRDSPKKSAAQETDNLTSSQTPADTCVTIGSDKPSQPVTEAMEVQSEPSPLDNDITDHQTFTPTQNGTKEISGLVNSGPHVDSSPKKSLSAIHKTYIPSSTAIDNRKFISNPAFPVEMMDPAYCFSMVSYNILADCHLCRGDYSYTQPQYLTQDYRHTLLLKELDYLDGDIVCLQEVGPDYYTNTLLPALKSQGYDGHFVKRTSENFNEGEATFVKTSKFDVVSHQVLLLKDLAFTEINSSGLSEDVAAAVKKYLDRPDVVLLTELHCKKSGKTITVCNTHIGHDRKAPDVQCMQAALAVKQLVTKAGGDKNPHIICGDFNSDISSPAYQLVRDGTLSDDSIHRLQALDNLDITDGSPRSLIHHMKTAFSHTSTNLKNAYELTLGKVPPVTAYTKTGKSVDHIFHSCASIENVGVLETLDLNVLETSGGLPSKSIPSDHLSLKAVFRIK